MLRRTDSLVTRNSFDRSHTALDSLRKNRGRVGQPVSSNFGAAPMDTSGVRDDIDDRVRSIAKTSHGSIVFLITRSFHVCHVEL